MSATSTILVIIGGLILLRAYKVAQAVKARLFHHLQLHLLSLVQTVKGVPSLICGIQPLSIVGSIFPTSWWNPGLYFVWDWKDSE